MELNYKRGNSVLRLCFLIVALLLIFFGLAVMFWAMYKEPEEGILFLGIFVPLMFALVLGIFYSFLTELRTRKISDPVVRIDENGFYDKRFHIKPVPWSKIDWKTRYSKGHLYICYSFRTSPDAYLLKHTLGGFNMKFSKLFGFGDMYLEPHFFDCDNQAILAEFQKYKPENNKRAL